MLRTVWCLWYILLLTTTFLLSMILSDEHVIYTSQVDFLDDSVFVLCKISITYSQYCSKRCITRTFKNKIEYVKYLQDLDYTHKSQIGYQQNCAVFCDPVERGVNHLKIRHTGF